MMMRQEEGATGTSESSTTSSSSVVSETNKKAETRGYPSSSSESASVSTAGVVVQGIKRRGVLPLRNYEVAMARLLEQVQPVYHHLPPSPPPPLAAARRLRLLEHSKHNQNQTHQQQQQKHRSDLWKFYFENENELDDGNSSFVSPARVYGNLPGQLPHLERARRKEDQVRSLLRCIAACLLPPLAVGEEKVDNDKEDSTNTINTDAAVVLPRTTTIVDFGGGSGHLALPLALMFPDLVKVVVVDLGRHSLDLLHRKAKECMSPSSSTTSTTTVDDSGTNIKEEVNGKKRSKFQRTEIPNLWTCCGPIDALEEEEEGDDDNVFRFDIGVALHLCGEATDVALRKCLESACCSAIIMAPCCVGKLNRNRKNPYIWQATGSNAPSITYPQSAVFCNILLRTTTSTTTTIYEGDNNNNDNNSDNSSGVSSWNALAKAADYSQVLEYKSSRNATRRTAKALVEWDRCLFIQEHNTQQQQQEQPRENTNFGPWQVILTRMEPWEASPKNDILVATRRHRSSSSSSSSSSYQESSNQKLRYHATTNITEDQEEEEDKKDQMWSSLLLPLATDYVCMADIEWTRRHLQVPWKKEQKRKAAQTCTTTTASAVAAIGAACQVISDDVNSNTKNNNIQNRCNSGRATATATAKVASSPRPKNSKPEPQEEVEAWQQKEQQHQQPKPAAGNGSNVDWTREEEHEMERFLCNYFFAVVAVAAPATHVLNNDNNSKNVYYFPTANLGKRKRKLVHHVADKLGLEHWSHRKTKGGSGGRGDGGGGGRTVAVARRGIRKTLLQTTNEIPRTFGII